MKNKKLIAASDSAYSYMGRIDFTEPDSPLFVYAGSMVSVKFTGTSLGVLLIPKLIYMQSQFGVILDGVQYCFDINHTDLPEYRYIPVAEDWTRESIPLRCSSAPPVLTATSISAACL